MSKHSTSWILVTLLLFLTACTSSTTQNGVPVSAKQVTIGATATATPIPAIPTVGALPRTCPISNPTHHLLGGMSLIGSAPAWATWIPGPSVYREGPLSNSNPPTNYDPVHGWEITKVVWEVGPHYTQSIRIQGQEESDHTRVLIQFGNDTPTSQAVLDPQHPGHPRSVLGDGWAEWGSYLVVPRAGCYSLEVSWPTGYWTVTFAFGA